MIRAVSFIFFFILLTPQAFAQNESRSTPEAAMDRLIELFRSYSRETDGKKLTEEESAKNGELKKEFENIFDYPALLKGALQDQWNAMTEKEQKEFYVRFKELVEMVAYPQGNYFYSNSKNDFKPPVIKGDIARIDSDNYNRKKDIEVKVSYIFRKHNGSWKLVDVELNDHGLVEAYRLQINRIVKKDGLKGLLEVMKKKHEEMRSEKRS